MDSELTTKSTQPSEVYTDDDYLPSWPCLQQFYPKLGYEEQEPDVDSDGEEDDLNEPWAIGLRLRPQRVNTWRQWLPEATSPTDAISGPGGPSWKDETLIEHMATSHGFDAASEAGRRGLPGLDTYSDYMNGERGMWTGKPQEQPFPTGLGSQLLGAHAPKKRTFIDDDLGVVAQPLGETFDPDRKRTRAAYTRRLRPALPLPQKTTTLQPSSIQIRRRKILPMVLENGGQTFSLSACPDSGSDVNVISLSEAQRLGCAIEPLGADVSKFYLANGQPAGAIGKAMAVCSFATGTPWTDSVLSCVFHVFSTLAVPLIMGMRFLEMTETLSKHQDRLVEEVAPSGHLIRVNSVGTPLKSLVCKLDGHEALAIADTGSDLDFLSESYARSRGFRIEEAFHEVILADGSVALTCGATRVPFAIGQVNEAGDFIPRSQTIEVCFLILEDLSSNILIGQDTALSINVFTEHAESFISSIAHAGESINIIRYKGKLDVAAGRAWAVLRGVRKDNATKLHQAERDFEFKDQRENARREKRQLEIQHLLGDERIRAEDEEARRIREYEERNCESRGLSLKSSDTSASGSTAAYICDFPDCAAPPFETAYLLHSHKYLHSSERPHFCPVRGCPRSQGGKGFKRKNEMIRHGLAHEKPGFICPFCPEKDHRYPHEGDLLRHVLAHHRDKSLIDPVLIEVLESPGERARFPTHDKSKPRRSPAFTGHSLK